MHDYVGMCLYSSGLSFINVSQMNAILGFKNVEEEDRENLLCRDDLRDRLNTIHEKLMKQVSLLALQDPSMEVDLSTYCIYYMYMSRFDNLPRAMAAPEHSFPTILLNIVFLLLPAQNPRLLWSSRLA